MIDCFVRSQWIAHLASEEEIKGFIEGNDPPGSTPKLVTMLEDQGFYSGGLLSEIIRKVWPVVCDFNHGGRRMVVRHLTGTEIAPSFSEEELEEALEAANAWALISASALADLAGDRALGERILEKGAALGTD